MADLEHDCKYARMIRTQPEWIKENGEELCAFCHTPRYIKVTRVIAERSKGLKSRDQINKELP